MSADAYKMRERCRWCNRTDDGRIESRNGQNCVYCAACFRHCYNAPKYETGEAPREVTKIVRGGLTLQKKARIRERDGNRCLMCGVGADKALLQVGHFLRVVDGVAAGLTEEEVSDDSNLVTICEACNLVLRDHSLPPRLLPTLIRVWREYERASRVGPTLRTEGMARHPAPQSEGGGLFMQEPEMPFAGKTPEDEERTP